MPLTGFALAPGPHRSVLLIDTSGSITGRPGEWTTTIGAGAQFAMGAPLSLSLALLSFGGRIETRTGFGEGRDAVNAKIAQLRAQRWDKVKHSRRTAIRDAVAGAVSEFDSPRLGDSILLITDGDDNESRREEGEVTRLLVASGVRLFALVLRSATTAPRGDSSASIAQAAEATGGLALELFVRENPRVQLQHLLGRMTWYYRADWTACAPGGKSRRLRLTVTPSGSGSGSKLRVAHPAYVR